jgi:hypothetical protein
MSLEKERRREEIEKNKTLCKLIKGIDKCDKDLLNR